MAKQALLMFVVLLAFLMAIMFFTEVEPRKLNAPRFGQQKLSNYRSELCYQDQKHCYIDSTCSSQECICLNKLNPNLDAHCVNKDCAGRDCKDDDDCFDPACVCDNKDKKEDEMSKCVSYPANNDVNLTVEAEVELVPNDEDMSSGCCSTS